MPPKRIRRAFKGQKSGAAHLGRETTVHGVVGVNVRRRRVLENRLNFRFRLGPFAA
jgi:hypothetical protein